MEFPSHFQSLYFGLIVMCQLLILVSLHRKVINTLEVTTVRTRTYKVRRIGCNFLYALKYFGATPSTTKSDWFSKFGILISLTQHALFSHSVTRNHGSNASSVNSMGRIRLNSSASVDNKYQLDYIKSQKPSKRFAKNRSDQEWERLHCEIMLKNKLEVMDIIDAEQCMRWWISQSRACVQKTKSGRFRTYRFNRQPHDSASGTDASKTHGNNAAKAIVSALDLFGRVVSAIEAQPELLQLGDNSSEAMENKAMNKWYDGYLPRATHLLNAILDAWRLCWIDLDSDNKHLPTPRSIFTLLKDNWCNLVPMNERTYSIVMDAPVASMSLVDDAHLQNDVPLFCEEVINFMLRVERKVPIYISEHARPLYTDCATLPDNVTYATALNAWARSGRDDSAKRAEALFNQFTALCGNGTLPTLPNTFCYNTVLVAMSAPPTSFVRQRSILLRKVKNADQELDPALVENVLRRQDALLLADDMFCSMQLCASPNVMPNTISFRTIIFAWAEYSVDLRYVDRNKSRIAMDRAVALLYEMAHLRVDSCNTAIDIDYSFFGKIISTLALNQPKVIDEYVRSDLRRAEELYQYMLNLYRSTRDDRFTPDTTLLCAMTLVYAKDGRPLEAEAILARLENEARSRNQPSLLPRISYYRDTLGACMDFAANEMKCGKRDSACIAADKAESLIIRMIDIANVTGNVNNVPDRITLNNMLELWIKCETPRRAENYYRCIESLYEATQCEILRWKPIHLRYLLSAWTNNCKDSTTFAAQQAETVLKEMQQKYEESHDVRYRPSVVSVSLVIAAWLRTGHSELVGKCKGLFDEAVAAYGAGNVQARPDTALYGSLLKACSRVGDGKGAMEFLEAMKNDYFNNLNHSAKPNIEIFNLVLLSWLKSTDANAPKSALHLFETMQASDIKVKLRIEPNYRTFSILCEILARTKGQGFEEKYNHFVEKRNRLANTAGV